jgi:hypothetical protein
MTAPSIRLFGHNEALPRDAALSQA